MNDELVPQTSSFALSSVSELVAVPVLEQPAKANAARNTKRTAFIAGSTYQNLDDMALGFLA